MKWILLIIFLQSSVAFSQELVDRQYQGTSKNSNLNEARKEIQEQISLLATEEFSKQILGEEKFLRNRNTITKKVIKSSGRYIPFQKPGPIQSSGDGYSMAVAMKINPQILRQVLQQNGLLNENESAPVILPLIHVTDRVQLRSDRWWNNSGSEVSVPLRNLSRRLENSLRSSFLKAGFFVLRPVTSDLNEALPAPLKVEKHSPDDLRLLGEWFGVPLVIEGELLLTRPSEVSSTVVKMEVRMQVIQTSDHRPIADVSRTYESDPGPFEVVVERKLRDISEAMVNDLVSQVAEAWQKGAVGSSQIRLNLAQQMKLPDIEKFKKSLLSSNLGLRTVKERLVTSSGVVFEVESPMSLTELAQKMNGIQIGDKSLRAQAAENEIKLQIAK